MLAPLVALLGTEFFVIATTTGGTLDFAQKITDFLGFAESLDKNIKKLLNTPLNTGIRNLDYARNNPVNSIEYINEAIQSFTNSLTLEKNERLVCAYLGLAFCFHLKGDIINCKQILEEFCNKDIDVLSDASEDLKLMAKNPLKTVVSMFNPRLLKTTFTFYRNHKIFYLKQVKKLSKDVNFLEQTIKVLGRKQNEPNITEIYFVDSYVRQLEIVKLQNQAKKQIEDYEKYSSNMESILINYRRKIGVG
jgi:hypothetical protein